MSTTNQLDGCHVIGQKDAEISMHDGVTYCGPIWADSKGVNFILYRNERYNVTHDGVAWRLLKTLQELAKDALAIQDACNLSGVVHSFSRAMHHLTSRLRADGLYEGTQSVNRHPICTMWADKIASLSGVYQFADAYNKVVELANATPVSSDT